MHSHKNSESMNIKDILEKLKPELDKNEISHSINTDEDRLRLAPELVTPVISNSSNEKVATRTRCKTTELETLGSLVIGRNYVYELILKDDSPCGSIDFKMVTNPSICERTTVYIDENNNKLPHLILEYMRNMSNRYYKYVGNVLHEFAFRFSIKNGGEGRVSLEAVRNTHYFHFKNGYRYRAAYGLYDYFKLAKALINAPDEIIKEDLGCQAMYLPTKSIKSNLERFKITHKLEGPVLQRELDEQFMRDMLAGELLIQEAEHFIKDRSSNNCVVIKTLMAIEDDFGRNSSILISALKMISDLLPMDSAENKEKFATFVVGIIKHATNERYPSPRFIPAENSSLHHGPSITTLLSIGEKALMSKEAAIDWDSAEISQFKLKRVSELRMLIEDLYKNNLRQNQGRITPQ